MNKSKQHIRILIVAVCLFAAAAGLCGGALYRSSGVADDPATLPAATISTATAPLQALGEEEEIVSTAEIRYAYFKLHRPATTAETADATEPADAIYVVDDLAEDTLLALYNIVTWSRAGSESIFSDAILEAAGSEDGDWYAIGAGRFGYGSEDYGLYLAAMEKNLAGQELAAAELPRLILTIAALGGDPTAFGAAERDLIAELCAGGALPTGAEALASTLLALDCLSFELPADAAFDRDALIAALLDCELADGGFAAAGQRADAATGAAVLTALAPYAAQTEVAAAIERTLDGLSAAQLADGGFAAYGLANVQSSAAVLVALCTLGIDPDSDARFLKDGHSVLDGLFGYYVVKDGAFGAQAGSGADFASTDRCFLALTAYYRLNAGLTPLYDMSGSTPEPPSPTDDGAEKTAALDAAIAKDALPLQVTLADAELVEALMTQYNALADEDKAKLVHGEELLLSARIIAGLQKNIVIKEVFELLIGTENEYVVSGLIDGTYGYSITFHGQAISEAKDFDARILTVPAAKERIDLRAKKPIYLHFPQRGSFPGKAEIRINLGQKGSYMLYHYDAEADDFSLLKTLRLDGGEFSFAADRGGDYFLSQKSVSRLRAAYSAADFEGGVVPRSVFESIRGENVNLVLEVEIGDGLTATLTFNGQDIEKPMDFHSCIGLETDNAKFIRQLAEEPFILHFEQEGELPGQALVELKGLPLENQNTLLFRYDSAKMKAEYVQKLTIDDGASRFILKQGGDHFIAGRAKAKSLLDGEAETEGGTTTAAIIPGIPLYVMIAGGTLLVIAVGAVIFARRRKKKTHKEARS